MGPVGESLVSSRVALNIDEQWGSFFVWFRNNRIVPADALQILARAPRQM
jgi:hypothetical protein